MSGFALIFDTQSPVSPSDPDFVAFKSDVAGYKQLDQARSCEMAGQQYVAVKFDTRSTLHKGITVDEQTGSWMLAVGTVLRSEDNPEDGALQDLLIDYLKRGNVAFESLDGQFALVAYDGSTEKLAIVSDPLGLISVFYAQRGNRVYAATSALAVAQAVQATPSEYGVYLFLNVGAVYGKSTLWQEVARLAAGAVLEIGSTGSTESVYWSPMVKEEIARLSLEETVDHTLALFSHLAKHYLKREGKVWADLTGGFDSRFVTMMMDYGGLEFAACCQGPVASPDVRISSHIAQELGWDYKHNMLPDDWGRERYERLDQALGKGDGHLDVFKLTSVLWDQDQRALERGTSIWGLGGELWRGTIWKQEFWNMGKTRQVNYDRLIGYRVMQSVDSAVFRDVGRVAWIRERVKTLLMSIGEQYSDWPNTVQLDRIFAYKVTGLTGGHMSAVMGQQRAICPLDFKESVQNAISINYKWRRHSRLFRLLMERVNPTLASIATTDGGPALPMRITNLHKFRSYWSLIAKQLVRKSSRAVLGRSLLPPLRDEFSTYPQARWRRETLNYLEQDEVLDPDHMHSGRLYEAEALERFLNQARSETFGQESFLSRILTVELALRAVGASF